MEIGLVKLVCTGGNGASLKVKIRVAVARHDTGIKTVFTLCILRMDGRGADQCSNGGCSQKREFHGVFLVWCNAKRTLFIA